MVAIDISSGVDGEIVTTFNITEFDIIFISYDEPNAERHWSDLIEKAPWAKRVHGIKGFDAAHRACAVQADTDWFITVDADNIVRQEFFDIEVRFDPKIEPRRCFSWNGLNAINGLAYGNGGLKLWSKEYVMEMQSHENANDPRKAVDFCWEDNYQQVYRTYSDVWNNCTPYQAFRVGFREGVKLALNRGCRVSAEMMKHLHEQNLRNLRVWSCVGAHIENGLWAMFGTRLAWRQMCNITWDHTVVRDYDWFKTFWPTVADTDLLPACEQLGQEITQMTKIGIPVLTTVVSEFFRTALAQHNE